MHNQVNQNIKLYGWHCQYVVDKEGILPPFGYSIGFVERFGHADILIFGLDKQRTHRFLSLIAKYLASGYVFEPHRLYDHLIQHRLSVLFCPMRQQYLPKYMGIALNHYQAVQPAMVMLWPNAQNQLPYHWPKEHNCQREGMMISQSHSRFCQPKGATSNGCMVAT